MYIKINNFSEFCWPVPYSSYKDWDKGKIVLFYVFDITKKDNSGIYGALETGCSVGKISSVLPH